MAKYRAHRLEIRLLVSKHNFRFCILKLIDLSIEKDFRNDHDLHLII